MRCTRLQLVGIALTVSVVLLFSGCAINLGSMTLKPSQKLMTAGKMYPLSVAMVAGEDLMFFEAKAKDAMGGPLVSYYHGLQNLYSQVLVSHFETVDPLKEGDPIPEDDYDLVARMAVDKYHGKCGMTLGMKESVITIDMTFVLEDRDGNKVFTKTLSATGSEPPGRGVSGCNHMVDLSSRVFDDIFVQLTGALDDAPGLDEL